MPVLVTQEPQELHVTNVTTISQKYLYVCHGMIKYIFKDIVCSEIRVRSIF